jgi:hypothetical protein
MSAAREAVKAILTAAEFQLYFAEWAEKRGASQSAAVFDLVADRADWAAWRIAVASGEKDLMALWGAR